MFQRIAALLLVVTILANANCSRITAHNLDPCSNEREGIPYYLPKPYLVIAKNFHYIPTPTVGLTKPVAVPDAFDANAREVTLSGSLNQSRSLALERKLQETATRQESTTTNINVGQVDASAKPSANGQTSGNGGGTETGKAENGKKGMQPADNPKQSSGASDDRAPAQREADKQPSETTPTQPGRQGADGNGTGKQGTQPPSGSTPSGGTPELAPSGVMAANGQVLGPVDLNLVPSSPPIDGLTPVVYYTYQVLYLPDLTQKYGLVIHNGPGELRATMNLVNGWMNTGTGPLYMRDSTTAAKTLATGMAVSDVIDSIASLGFATATPAVGGLNQVLPALVAQQAQRALVGGPSQFRPTMGSIPDYAEIYIYEPEVYLDTTCSPPTKRVAWKLVPMQNIMSRPVLGVTSGQ